MDSGTSRADVVYLKDRGGLLRWLADYKQAPSGYGCQTRELICANMRLTEHLNQSIALRINPMMLMLVIIDRGLSGLR